MNSPVHICLSEESAASTIKVRVAYLKFSAVLGHTFMKSSILILPRGWPPRATSKNTTGLLGLAAEVTEEDMPQLLGCVKKNPVGGQVTKVVEHVVPTRDFSSLPSLMYWILLAVLYWGHSKAEVGVDWKAITNEHPYFQQLSSPFAYIQLDLSLVHFETLKELGV